MSAAMCLEEFDGEAAMRSFLKSGTPTYSQSAAQYFFRFAGSGNKEHHPLGIHRCRIGRQRRARMTLLIPAECAFVYEMLRESIGHAAFVAGLQFVVLHFAGKPASLVDLRTAWEAASGEDPDAVLPSVVRPDGRPELTLDWKVSSGRQRISRQWQHHPARRSLRVRRRGRCSSTAGLTREEDGPGLGCVDAVLLSHRPATSRELVLDPEYKNPSLDTGVPKRPIARRRTGLWSSGRRDEAVVKLEEYVSSVPEGLEGRYRLGICYQETGKLAEAEHSFPLRARSLCKPRRVRGRGDAEPAPLVGQLLDLAGRREDAGTAYRKALELSRRVAGARKRPGLASLRPYVFETEGGGAEPGTC